MADDRVTSAVRIASIDDVVELAMSDPALAIESATSLLADGDLDELGRARVAWASGTAKRELGDLDGATADLTTARDGAAGRDASLSIEIAMTWASVLLLRGNLARASEVLDAVSDTDDRRVQARLEMQRGLVLHRMGSLDAAEPAYDRAIELVVGIGDAIGEGRTRVNAGLLQIQRGDYAAAESHLLLARELTTSASQHVTLGIAEHNLGYLRICQGDLVGALTSYRSAAVAFEESGSRSHLGLLLADHATAAIEANLVDEAIELSTRAFDIVVEDGNEADTAEVALVLVEARLAAGDVSGALAASRTALTSLEDSGRSELVPVGRLAALTCLYAANPDAPELLESVAAVADRMAELGRVVDAIDARLLACKVQLVHGRLDAARQSLAALASSRRTAPASQRVAFELAAALLADAEHDTSGTRRAVRRGLQVVRDNHATLGALELRAHATDRATSLVQVGARLALAQRRGRELLALIEFARAMSALIPRPLPPDDDVLAGKLAALRTLTVSLRDEQDPRATREITASIAGLEAEVRSLSRLQKSEGLGADLALADAIDLLGDTHDLIEYGVIDGLLVAVVVANRRCSIVELGRIEDVAADIESMAFALNRLHRRQASAASIAAAMDVLEASRGSFEAAVIPRRLRRSDRPLVIVPTGLLHGVPWRSVVRPIDRPVTIAPSLTAWALGRRRAPVSASVVGLVSGPDLEAADAELDAVGSIYPERTELRGDGATVDRCLAMMQEVALVHFACHGLFRADNPLFSTLRLADGDLTIYDLQRCTSLPSVIVLSACDVAQNSALRGGGLLGMASALLQLGVSSVIAPLTPVNDQRSVDLMVRLHEHLAAGDAPSVALASASIRAAGDLDPAAASFICFGS